MILVVSFLVIRSAGIEKDYLNHLVIFITFSLPNILFTGLILLLSRVVIIINQSRLVLIYSMLANGLFILSLFVGFYLYLEKLYYLCFAFAFAKLVYVILLNIYLKKSYSISFLQGMWVDWKIVVKLSKIVLPVVYNLLLEVVVFVIANFFVETYSHLYSDAYHIIFQIYSFVYLFSVSISAFACKAIIQVEEEPGKNKIMVLLKYLTLYALFILILTFFLKVFFDDFIVLFTNRESIVVIVETAFYGFMILVLLDGLQTITGGALRAFRLFVIPFRINLACTLCIGIPCGYYLFQINENLSSIFIGLSIAYLLSFILQFIVLAKRDRELKLAQVTPNKHIETK